VEAAGGAEVSRESRAPRFRGTAGFRCASRVRSIWHSRSASASRGAPPPGRGSPGRLPPLVRSRNSLPYWITEYRRRRMELPDARVLHREPDMEGSQERKRFARSAARPRREVTRLRECSAMTPERDGVLRG